MPELPEVQTTVHGINQVAKHWVITDVWTDYYSPFYAQKNEIKNPEYFKIFREKIIGKTITHATRRAKNILIHLSESKTSANDCTILVHMKMTGHIMCGEYVYDNTAPDRVWRSKNNDEANPLNDPFNRFIHFVCTITKGSAVKHLVMSDMRKFGKVTLIEELDPHQSAELSAIGPEPLDDSFTFSDFQSRLQSRTPTPIKHILMDQSRIAGIGNIYSDEILWHAGVHPESAFSAIPQAIQKQMYVAMKDILRKGIDFGGDSMSDYRNIEGKRGAFQGEHKAYRKTKEPCQKDSCTGVISRMVISGRSSHFCSVHQQLYVQKK